MATSSINHGIILKTEKAANNLKKLMKAPKNSVKINRSLVSPENIQRGEDKLAKMLSR